MALMQKGHHAPVWVTGSVLSKSSAGNWQIVISFRNEAGESIDAYLATSEAARQYTEQKLAAVGYDLNAHDNDILPLNAGIESPIVGNETEIDVIEDSYRTESGETKKTLKVGRIGSGFREQAPASEAEFAAAAFRKLCVVAKGASRPTTKPAPRPTNPLL